MRKRMSILISSVILLITVYGVVYINYIKYCGSVGVENGVLNLEDWNFEKDGILELSGQWAFYPGVLIYPQKDADVFSGYENVKSLIRVPGTWDSYFRGSREYQKGTYRLLIRVPKDGAYGVRTRAILMSGRVFINGKEVISKGYAGEAPEEYISDSRFYIGAENSENGVVEVVIQVANRYYPSGGMIQALEFGPEKQLLKHRDGQRALEALIVSGYLMLGLYFITCHFHTSRRKRTLRMLYLGLVCLLQGVHRSTLNERLLDLIFADMDIYTLTNMQITLVYLHSVFFLLFIYDSFKEYTNPKTVRLFINVILFVGIPLQFIPFEYYTKIGVTILALQVWIVILVSISVIYSLCILIRALRKGVEASEYVLLVVTVLCAYGILQLLDFFDIFIGDLPVILFFFMVWSLALLTNYRSELAYAKIDVMSRRLLLLDNLKDEFLAKTSQNLNTPLRVIQNLVKAMMEGKDGTLNYKQQQSMLLIHNEGKRLLKMVEELLDASRIKQEGVRINPRPVSIKVIQDVMTEMNYLVPRGKSLNLYCRFPEDFPALLVDENRLKQIVYNLVHNAVKLTDKGEVGVTGEIKDNMAHITVSDTGCGFEEDNLELVFTSFYQGQKQSKDERRGLGLGLSITKNLVELHGGRIWLESKSGAGARITFTLPLADTEETRAAWNESAALDEALDILPPVPFFSEKLPVKIPGKDKVTVLVAGDDHGQLKYFAGIIHAMSFTVIAADNGSDIMDLIYKETPDLMILDLMMSGMGGDAVCRLVREEYSMAELPVLMLTATGQGVELNASFHSGANDLMKKPVSPEELKARVRSLISMKKSAQEAVKQELSFFHDQITPHFLYNTLNTIVSLSYIDQEMTREALRNLTIYFRGKLDLYNHSTLIPLENEIQLLKAYLSIEKIRYGDKLNIEYSIDESVAFMLPPLTIQPLVENAVRHGIAAKCDSGTIRFSVKRETRGEIRIDVTDDGPGIPEELLSKIMAGESGSIGLSNVLKKVRLIKRARLEITSREGRGTTASILAGVRE